MDRGFSGVWKEHIPFSTAAPESGTLAFRAPISTKGDALRTWGGAPEVSEKPPGGGDKPLPALQLRRTSAPLPRRAKFKGSSDESPQGPVGPWVSQATLHLGLCTLSPGEGPMHRCGDTAPGGSAGPGSPPCSRAGLLAESRAGAGRATWPVLQARPSPELGEAREPLQAHRGSLWPGHGHCPALSGSQAPGQPLGAQV